MVILEILSGFFVLPALVFISLAILGSENLITLLIGFCGVLPTWVRQIMRLFTLPLGLARKIIGLYPWFVHPEFYQEYPWLFEQTR